MSGEIVAIVRGKTKCCVSLCDQKVEEMKKLEVLLALMFERDYFKGRGNENNDCVREKADRCPTLLRLGSW